MVWTRASWQHVVLSSLVATGQASLAVAPACMETPDVSRWGRVNYRHGQPEPRVRTGPRLDLRQATASDALPTTETVAVTVSTSLSVTASVSQSDSVSIQPSSDSVAATTSVSDPPQAAPSVVTSTETLSETVLSGTEVRTAGATNTFSSAGATDTIVPTAHAQARPDPVLGPFIGGVPTSGIDLPITIVFLLLFFIGAATHFTIYRTNAKREHKFLLSDLMFEFCLIRACTCVMRIVWIYSKNKVVVYLAMALTLGGAALLFVINIFFTQRLVRSMHPRFGWTPFFRVFTLILAFSVPAAILLNIVALGFSFFLQSDDPDSFTVLRSLVKFGSSWTLGLTVYPLVALFLCACFPGPPQERFGKGPFRVKLAIVVYAAVTLLAGSAVRLATLQNPVQPGTEQDSPIFRRETLYTTCFLLEILIVILFAVARVDLRFHVPDGSKGPGDYSAVAHEEGVPLVHDAEMEYTKADNGSYDVPKREVVEPEKRDRESLLPLAYGKPAGGTSHADRRPNLELRRKRVARGSEPYSLPRKSRPGQTEAEQRGEWQQLQLARASRVARNADPVEIPDVIIRTTTVPSRSRVDASGPPVYQHVSADVYPYPYPYEVHLGSASGDERWQFDDGLPDRSSYGPMSR